MTDDPSPRRTALLLALIVAAGLVPRLWAIDEPILVFHAWRQTETASIARNVWRDGLDFLHPRIDTNGRGPDLVESELQVYPLAVACLYSVFGVHEVLGRLLSVGAWLATLPFLAWLARRCAGPVGMLAALAVFAVSPLSVVMSQAFMPDATCLAFSVAALALFWRWLEEGGRWRALAAGACLGLAIGVKVVALYLGLPFLALVLCYRGPRGLRQPDVWGVALLGLVPPLAWYLYARTFPVSFGFWSLGPQRLENWLGWWSLPFAKVLWPFVARFALTPPVALVAVLGAAGACWLAPRPVGAVVGAWGLGLLLYVALTANAMVHHAYYCLPLTPFAAVAAGWLVARAWDAEALAGRGALVRPLLAVGLAAASLWSSASQLWPRMYRLELLPRQMALLARMVADRTAPGSLVVTSVGHGTPEVLYYADRRGWHLPYASATVAALKPLHAKGATHFAAVMPLRPDALPCDGARHPIRSVVERWLEGGWQGNVVIGEGQATACLSPLGQWLSACPADATTQPNLVHSMFRRIARVVHSGKGLDELVGGLGVESFVLPLPSTVDGPPSFGLVRVLLDSPGWCLVEIHDGGLIFVRADGLNAERAGRRAYRYLDPTQPENPSRVAEPDAALLARCLAEAERAHREHPTSVRCVELLTKLCLRLRLFDRGLEVTSEPWLVEGAPKTSRMNQVVFLMNAGRRAEAAAVAQDFRARFPAQAEAMDKLLRELEASTPPAP